MTLYETIWVLTHSIEGATDGMRDRESADRQDVEVRCFFLGRYMAMANEVGRNDVEFGRGSCITIRRHAGDL